MNTKRAKNIYIHLKNYLSCLTSSFSIKISKMNRKPNPKVLLYYCPCTQATGEGEKGLLHLCIWASALQLISVSPNRTLGLKWKNEKCSKHLYTLKNSANPEIHHHLAKKKRLQTTILQVIAQTGNMGRGGDFFHRMNLNFHHVPKYPWKGLGTKWSNRKRNKKYSYTLTVHIPTLVEIEKSPRLLQNYCPQRQQGKGKRGDFHTSGPPCLIRYLRVQPRDG